MKASQLFSPTLREVPSEAEVISHQLLLRAGFIRKSSAGVYSYLPLARRVLRKIETIVREEMDWAGGQEVLMPIIQPQELWERTGRWIFFRSWLWGNYAVLFLFQYPSLFGVHHSPHTSGHYHVLSDHLTADQ